MAAHDTFLWHCHCSKGKRKHIIYKCSNAKILLQNGATVFLEPAPNILTRAVYVGCREIVLLRLFLLWFWFEDSVYFVCHLQICWTLQRYYVTSDDDSEWDWNQIASIVYMLQLRRLFSALAWIKLTVWMTASSTYYKQEDCSVPLLGSSWQSGRQLPVHLAI
jgi:hypothetical protein